MEKSRLRELLLYEFRKGSTTTEAYKNICQTEGPDVVSYSTVKYWFRKFSSGDEDLSDQPRSGRPTTFDQEFLTEALSICPTSSTRQLAADIGSSKSTVSRHLHELGFTNKKCIEVPHALTVTQKEQRINICSDLSRFEAGMSLSQIITCDEKWIFLDNRKPETQWVQPGETPVQTTKRKQHDPKVLLCIWWCSSGIIYFELLPNNMTITADVYQRQLQQVQHNIRNIKFSTTFRPGVLFLQDNARPHIANNTLQKIHELRWTVLPHPAYSPDISPSNYHLFRSMEHFLRGMVFTDREQVEKGLDRFFRSKNQEFYRKGIEILPERWEKIIKQNGDYIIN
jgi:[histone H3]-lysine36 N-dimethyltransferase SETMAR